MFALCALLRPPRAADLCLYFVSQGIDAGAPYHDTAGLLGSTVLWIYGSFIGKATKIDDWRDERLPGLPHT